MKFVHSLVPDITLQIKQEAVITIALDGKTVCSIAAKIQRYDNSLHHYQFTSMQTGHNTCRKICVNTDREISVSCPYRIACRNDAQIA